jgi:hypothetical protein
MPQRCASAADWQKPHNCIALHADTCRKRINATAHELSHRPMTADTTLQHANMGRTTLAPYLSSNLYTAPYLPANVTAAVGRAVHLLMSQAAMEHDSTPPAVARSLCICAPSASADKARCSLRWRHQAALKAHICHHSTFCKGLQTCTAAAVRVLGNRDVGEPSPLPPCTLSDDESDARNERSTLTLS